MSRRALLACAALLFVAVLAFEVVVELHGFFPGDVRTRMFVEQHLHGGRLAHTAITYEHIADPLFALLTIAVLVLVAPAYAPAVLACATVVVASSLLKGLFGPSDLQQAVHPGTGGTLPSGHTAWAAAVFGLAAVLAWRAGRRWIACAALLVLAAMGPARVVTESHWTGDVLAGYALGLGWLAGVLALVPVPVRRLSWRR